MSRMGPVIIFLAICILTQLQRIRIHEHFLINGSLKFMYSLLTFFENTVPHSIEDFQRKYQHQIGIITLQYEIPKDRIKEQKQLGDF